jgi:hypothetical protein
MTGFASMFGLSSGVRAGLRLIVIDFLLAFVLIWGTVLTVGVARSRAHAEVLPGIKAVVRSIAGQQEASPAVWETVLPGAGSYTEDRVGRTGVATYLLLSLWISALAALDLGFWRHLRRAYASPRRGTWRRG